MPRDWLGGGCGLCLFWKKGCVCGSLQGAGRREVCRCVPTMPKPSLLSGCSRCCLGCAVCLFGTIGSNCQQCAQLWPQLHGEGKTHPPAHCPCCFLSGSLPAALGLDGSFQRGLSAYTPSPALFCFLICAPFPSALSSGSSYLTAGSWEAWHAAIHGVAKSRTRLSDWSDLIFYEMIAPWWQELVPFVLCSIFST